MVMYNTYLATLSFKKYVKNIETELDQVKNKFLNNHQNHQVMFERFDFKDCNIDWPRLVFK